MVILNITILLLFISFVTHVAWWRIKIPHHSFRCLLFCFIGTPCLLIVLYYFLYRDTVFPFQANELFRIALLYSSCSLVYIILYSAIEQQSPTLAIVQYIRKTGKDGSSEQDILDYIRGIDGISKRLQLMEQGNWVTVIKGKWQLTKKGKQLAFIFEYAALLFGLVKGG